MPSSIGNALKITIFGESHGPAIGMTIDGLPAGVKIPHERIQNALKNRKTNDSLSTRRNEKNEVIYLSGVFEDHTTGTPLTFIIENKDVDSSKYQKGVIRPGHADLVNYLSTNGNNDYRGAGFSSGRITTTIIVLGEICGEILAKTGILYASRLVNVHGIIDDSKLTNKAEIEALRNNPFPVLSDKAKEAMMNEIKAAQANEDSVGGEVLTEIRNAPIGLGNPFFDSFESYISQLVFSIGGVKGINFGDCNAFVNKFGSETNDQIRYDGCRIKYLSNHAGGINGGLTNGNTIYFTTIVKPTSSIGKRQHTVNVETKENLNIEISGRHDPCIVHRVAKVIDALVAYALLDLLMAKESKNIWFSLV